MVCRSIIFRVSLDISICRKVLFSIPVKVHTPTHNEWKFVMLVGDSASVSLYNME